MHLTPFSYAHVCIYVHEYVLSCLCLCVSVCMYKCVCLFACMCVYVVDCVFMCVCVCEFDCVFLLLFLACVCACVYVGGGEGVSYLYVYIFFLRRRSNRLVSRLQYLYILALLFLPASRMPPFPCWQLRGPREKGSRDASCSSQRRRVSRFARTLQ